VPRASHMKKRSQAASQPKREEDDQNTRQRLLEIAGQVFAEKGFDRATGKEICERASTNTAAVNYYFGGMEGLYTAVLQEAASRLVISDALRAAIAGQTDAKAKLEAFLGLFVQALTGPASESWVLRVIGREALAPSPVLVALQGKERLQRARILKAVVGELMGLPEDHPAVARGCVSVIAPCFLLLICDRPALKQMFPNLGFAPKDAPAVLRHLVEFALAGLSAIASDARKEAYGA
jgi:AcrR family transcriptional regulator